LDDALRIAQRYEVFKGAVESSAATRSRRNSFVAEVQEDQVKPGGKVCTNMKPFASAPDTGNSQNYSRRTGFVNLESGGDTQWKTNIIRRLVNLEAAKSEAEQCAELLATENIALTKGVDKFSHFEQLRAAPSWQNSGPVQQPQCLLNDQRCSLVRRVLVLSVVSLEILDKNAQPEIHYCSRVWRWEVQCPLRSTYEREWEGVPVTAYWIPAAM